MAIRVSELPLNTSMTGDDLILVIDSPYSGGTTKRITFNDFMKEVYTPVVFSNNVTIGGDLIVSTNTVFSNLHIIESNTTSSPVSSFYPSAKGKIWFDSEYLYIAVDDNTVKRVALSSF